MHDVGLITFPWYPSLETGRGHDTYTFHLLNHLTHSNLNIKVFPIITVKHLQQGVNKFDYISKEALFLTKMFTPKTRIYHAISHLGSKTAILVNKHPVITTIHDAIPFIHYRDIRQAYERLCIKICCDKSERIIVSSEFTGHYLTSKLQLDPKKIRIIKYGVDHQFFNCRPKKEKSEKILFTIIRWSNLIQLLSAFKRVKDEIKDVKLYLGLKHSFDGDYREYVPSLIGKLNLKESVKILYDIPTSQLPHYYNIADAYVSASLGGFSLTLLESMACGTPVIAFNLLDIPEYVEKDGILVAPNNFKALADQTIQLLLDDKLRKQLSKKSLEKSKSFSWKKMALETSKEYIDLL